MACCAARHRALARLLWGALLRAHKEFEERVGTIGRGAKGYMVRLMLGTMKAEGLIVPTGKGRGVKWVSVIHQQKSQE